MSKFEFELVPELDLMIARVRRVVTPREYMVFLQDTVGKEDAKNIIWVFAPGVLQLFDIEDIKDIPRKRAPEWQKRAGGHAFFVAEDPSENLLIRWYEAYRETATDQPYAIHRSESEAGAIERMKELLDES